MPLTSGFNHVAILTEDLDRLVRFYESTFEVVAPARWNLDEPGPRHVMLDLGGGAGLHAFEATGSPHATGSPTMFERGHIDHLAINVPDEATFAQLRRRLVDAGVSDGTITDFGMVWSVSFRDPDGLDAEVVLWRDQPPIAFLDRGQYAYPDTA